MSTHSDHLQKYLAEKFKVLMSDPAIKISSLENAHRAAKDGYVFLITASVDSKNDPANLCKCAQDALDAVFKGTGEALCWAASETKNGKCIITLNVRNATLAASAARTQDRDVYARAQQNSEITR